MTAQEMIDNFRRYQKEGFTEKELIQLCDKNKIDYDKFADKLGVNTGMVIGGDFITYEWDVELALRCVLEDRDKTVFEWD